MSSFAGGTPRAARDETGPDSGSLRADGKRKGMRSGMLAECGSCRCDVPAASLQSFCAPLGRPAKTSWRWRTGVRMRNGGRTDPGAAPCAVDRVRGGVCRSDARQVLDRASCCSPNCTIGARGRQRYASGCGDKRPPSGPAMDRQWRGPVRADRLVPPRPTGAVVAKVRVKAKKSRARCLPGFQGPNPRSRCENQSILAFAFRHLFRSA